MYEYRDFVTGKPRRTRGTFERWTEPTGLLNVPYAIFKNRKGRVLIPVYSLTKETLAELPPIDKEPTMADKMQDAIFKVMSRHRNYSYDEIEDVFLRLRSYDKTIAAMQIASVFSVSLNRAAELIKTD